MLTRHEDVVAIHKKDLPLTAERVSPLMNQLPEAIQAEVQPLRNHLQAWMQMIEPPHHTRLRNLESKAFTSRMVEDLRPRVQHVVDALLDAIGDARETDMTHNFAGPLPTVVIGEMLGIPTSDQAQFKEWSDNIAVVLEGVGPTIVEQVRVGHQSVLELTEYISAIAEQRRKRPERDLITALVAVEDDGDKLSGEELIGMCSFLLVAGNETTTGLVGNGLLALLQNPDEMQKLKSDPELIKNAIEEFIRYDGPLHRNTRVATEDFEFRGKQN